MPQQDPKEAIRRLAEAAAIPISEERIVLLAQTLPLIQQGMQALSQLDLGEREPAMIFRP